MRKALLLMRHDIIGQYSDRGAVYRALVFVALPIIIVFVNRGAASARGASAVLLLVYAFYAALLPAASAVNAAAGSFAGEKEAQTLVPLLAAPIRDIDIVAGKLLATLVPSTALSIVSILAFYVAATVEFGAARVARVLTPEMLYVFAALGMFFVLTLGSWVMVLSSRASSQRAAQQIAGLITAGMLIGLTAIGTLLARSLDWEILLAAVLAVLASDVIALELARRLWNREEAIARI